jgi:hypothetical protein
VLFVSKQRIQKEKKHPSILFTTHSRVVIFIVVFSFSFSHPEIWQLRKKNLKSTFVFGISKIDKSCPKTSEIS